MIVVGDADALIALYLQNDRNHPDSVVISESLYKSGAQIIFPNTAIIEAVTTFQRKFSNPALAMLLVKHYQKGELQIEYIDPKIMKLAADIFDPSGSKQNTFFDAIVAACAKTLTADAIFSFDSWYKKIGFKLVSDL